jgi:ubiquinone/menaquinone biosynthesis C-methylase UbiE
MLKNGVRIIKKRGLCYIVGKDGSVERFKPWLGDCFSFLYDFIMKRSIFPRKFGGDMGIHNEILCYVLHDVRKENVLELATGSGSAAGFLANDNRYTGTDISTGLLKKAMKVFKAAGFEGAGFYVASADELPFKDNLFDTCLCMLSLNFFTEVERVFQEIRRVLVSGGTFVCSVPVPERNRARSTIHGTLYSEDELMRMCRALGFRYEGLPFENGALLYFKATVP